jgi:hypothetical protein
MGRDLAQIIEDISVGDSSGLGGAGMPSIARTTTTKKEFAPKVRIYETRFFPINNDTDAIAYSSFMNWILFDRKNRAIIREESSWTKEGELIRVVDFVRLAGDPFDPNFDAEAMSNKKEEKDDITRESLSETEQVTDTGKRFTLDDYVAG